MYIFLSLTLNSNVCLLGEKDCFSYAFVKWSRFSLPFIKVVIKVETTLYHVKRNRSAKIPLTHVKCEVC